VIPFHGFHGVLISDFLIPLEKKKNKTKQKKHTKKTTQPQKANTKAA